MLATVFGGGGDARCLNIVVFGDSLLTRFRRVDILAKPWGELLETMGFDFQGSHNDSLLYARHRAPGDRRRKRGNINERFGSTHVLLGPKLKGETKNEAHPDC